jgi:WD40 repeat protein
MADKTLLDELLTRWQTEAAQGRTLSATEICRDHPELATELEQRIHAGQNPGTGISQDDEKATIRAFVDPVAVTCSILQGTLKDQGSSAHRWETSAANLTIAGYEILSTLGRGGMGVVYQARQVKLGRVVALKMILSGEHAGPNDLARFRTEAEMIAHLQHPNIVQIYEVGEHEGRPFFSLEFCAGGALDKKLSGTPLPAHDAARIVATLARAVHAAHQANIIHRDLKPANVLFMEDGTLKITDFGLAKKLDEVGRTATGDVMGTPSYMAPEQACGAASLIAPATDVYALGAILYECMTGRPPFKAATTLDTISQVVAEEPVAPKRLQTKTPRDLETICLKCLRKEPARRYTSAAALADDLDRFLKGEPILARPAGRTERAVKWAWRRPTAAALVAVSALAVLVVIAGLLFFTSRLNMRNSELSMALGRAEEETNAKIREAIAKDLALKAAKKSRQEAEFARHESQRNLYFAEMNLAGQTNQADGRAAAMIDEVLSRWRPATGEPDLRGWEWYYLRSVFTKPQLDLHGHRDQVWRVRWSADGQRLASASTDRTIQIWDAVNGQRIQTLRGHTQPIKALAGCITGKLIASGDSDGVIHLWDADSGKLLRQFHHRALVGDLSFNPDGHRLASAGADGTVKVWDTETGDQHVELRGSASTRCVRFNPDGTQLACGGEDGQLHIWDVTTLKRKTITQRQGAWIESVSWSPDGHRLAVAVADGPPFPCLRTWDADSGELIRSMSGPVTNLRSVDWSPDGRLLATGDLEQTVRLWESDSGRMRTVIRLPGRAAGVQSVSWSPDGTRLAAAVRDETVKVWETAGLLANSSSLDDIPPTESVRWSPDSQLLALGGRDGVVRLWDAATRQLTGSLKSQANSVWSMAWNPDGRRIAVSGKGPEITVWDARAKQVVTTLTGHRLGVSSLAWNHNGTLLASGSHDGMILIWDCNRPTEPVKLEGHASPIRVVCWSPDDRRIASCASGHNDATFRIWDVDTRSELHQLKDHEWHYALSWSPKDTRLAIPGRLWDTQTKRETVRLSGHTKGEFALCWSPDARRIASGGRDRTVRIWEPDTGRQIVSLPALSQNMGALDWSSDGRCLASAGELEWKVRLWDALPGYLAERSPLALPELDRRLRINPHSFPDLMTRAEVHARAGQWQSAAADWREAVRDQKGYAPWFIGGWWVAGPFPATFQALEETALEIDPSQPAAANAQTGETSTLRWRAAEASTDGCLNLATLFPNPEEKQSAYVVVRVYSPREEPAKVRLESAGEAKLHVNGAAVRTLDAAEGSWVEGEGAAALKEGWNTLLFRVSLRSDPNQIRLNLIKP